MCGISHSPGLLATECAQSVHYLKNEPQPNHNQGRNPDRKQQEPHMDTPCRKHQYIATQHTGYGTGCTERRNKQILTEEIGRKHVRQPGKYPCQ